MNSTRSWAELPLVQLDHPAQAGYWLADNHSIAPEYENALRDRFRPTEEDATALVAAVERATQQTASHRHTHELDNLYRLHLSEEQTEVYKRLALSPSRAGEYIRWFGGVATAALAGERLSRKIKKISLDLGGQAQYGGWGTAKALDRLERSLPSQLMALDEHADLRARENPLNYLLMPMVEPGSHRLDYALLRQRGGVLDMRNVRVYRQSFAVIVVNQMDPQLSQAIRRAFDVERRAIRAQKHTRLARTIGKIF